MYCWIGGDHPEVLIKEARKKVDAGYSPVKMNATGKMTWITSMKDVNHVVENIALLRQEFGSDLDVGLDFHGRVHKGMVKPLFANLEQYKPLFIEEPVLS